MTREILFEAIGLIDDSFVAAVEKTPKKSPVWLKIVSVAACLVLIGVGAVAAHSYISPSAPPVTDPPFLVYGENGCYITPPPDDNVAVSPTPSLPFVVTYPDSDERIIVKDGVDQSFLSQHNSAPSPGEYWNDIYLPAEWENHDPNTVYWAEIRLWDKKGPVLTGTTLYDEAARLAANGYEIFLREESETGYWGEEKRTTHLCGYFTKEHLEHFPARGSLGYIIEYCREDVADCSRLYLMSDGTAKAIVTAPELVDIFGYDEQVDKDDFSHLYINSVRKLLVMLKYDSAFAYERECGVLFLDTDGVTQTACDLLAADIQTHAAEAYSLTVDTCTREQAEEKGYIQQLEDTTLAHCVWIIIHDQRIDDTTVQTSICMYGGDRASYTVELTLKQQGDEWDVTEILSSLS